MPSHKKFTIKPVWVENTAPCESDIEDILYEHATMCDLVISGYNHIFTRNIDTRSGRQYTSIRVSAYPLALWFAVNYWKLMYEPVGQQNNEESYAYASTHNLTYAGDGYNWPDLRFSTDGGNITMRFHKQTHTFGTKYTTRDKTGTVIARASFHQEILTFISLTVVRLCEKNMPDSELAHMYNEIVSTISTPERKWSNILYAVNGIDDRDGYTFIDIINSLKKYKKNFNRYVSQFRDEIKPPHTLYSNYVWIRFL